MAMHTDEAAAFADIERRLRAQFSPAVPEGVIVQELRSEVEAFGDARIRTYLPVLLQRRVTDRLRHYA